LFNKFDVDGNGLLSANEVKNNKQNILDLFDAHVGLTDSLGKTGELYFSDIIVPGAFDGAPQGSDHLRFIRRYQWQQVPQEINLKYTLFNTLVTQILVTFVRGEVTETATLTVTESHHRFGNTLLPK
jgi:hypothetical protein